VFIWASTVIMAVLVKSSPPCTVTGRKPLVIQWMLIFPWRPRQRAKLGYN
jgi:hypothetical protein